MPWVASVELSRHLHFVAHHHSSASAPLASVQRYARVYVHQTNGTSDWNIRDQDHRYSSNPLFTQSYECLFQVHADAPFISLPHEISRQASCVSSSRFRGKGACQVRLVSHQLARANATVHCHVIRTDRSVGEQRLRVRRPVLRI